MQKQEKDIWQILELVKDPEIPVLSIIDLGIVRSITISNINNDHRESEVIVHVTPTYSACPAVDMINTDIKMILTTAGYKNIKIEQSLFRLAQVVVRLQAQQGKYCHLFVIDRVRSGSQGNILPSTAALSASARPRFRRRCGRSC